MAGSVTAAFIAQYTNEVHQLFQQEGSKLMPTVNTHKNVVGSTYNFHKLGAVVANTKTRDADVTPLNPTSTQVTATLADYYAPIYLDSLDAIKSNANLKAEYQKASVNAIARQVDDVIIAEMLNATNTTTTTSGGLTLAKILEVVTYLNGNDVGEGDRYLLVGAKQVGEALAIQQLTSSDYVQVQAIMNSGIGTALGFKWILSTRLTAASATKVIGYVPESVGLAVGQDIKTEINYVPQKAAWLTNSSVSLGAKLIDNLGISLMTVA